MHTCMLPGINLCTNTGENKCLHSLIANENMRFEVMAVAINSKVFWNVKEISPDNGGSRFFWNAGNKFVPLDVT